MKKLYHYIRSLRTFVLLQKEVVPTDKSESEDFIKKVMKYSISVFLIFLFASCASVEQEAKPSGKWHNQTRELRYQPDGNGFVIHNGTHRFNRALYGSNTGFRVEAGDLPEFAMYMPRMGGNLKFGLISGETSKWLITAESIKARYEAGTMTYIIGDPLLKGGLIHIQVLALEDADGMILKVSGEKVPGDVDLFWAFGGASGKRFSRDGDLGADPESSFYLKPEYCKGDEYFTKDNSFNLYYASGRTPSDNQVSDYKPSPEELKHPELLQKKRIFGLVPVQSEIKIGDAGSQNNPLDFYRSGKSDLPAISGILKLNRDEENFFLLVNPDTRIRPDYNELPELFTQADQARKALEDRIKIETPDPYINAVGATLATAADAVWDGKSFMHGAIAWRMPLNGWRGAYAADWLGWHDRAETHFRGYFKSQYTEPLSGPSVPDPKTHLARQKEEVGTALFTSGYISRRPGGINKPHHYDMNLVFISQLLSHFNWTGDMDFLRESWPVLERHLAWEKRCFDPDDDGLYNAYACIWASDALQYRGGDVTHSSAYNYRANKIAAQLAPLIGKDPAPYAAEAEKIKRAVNEKLWLSDLGRFAEYKDLLGNQLVHPDAAVWTVYHAVDEGVADPFQAWQSTDYIDHYIPHIPVEAKGLESGKYYTISTTNWMPYTWSINNVALAEVLHTALAYWQSGRSDKAFKLTKSSFLDYMFMGASPGNFGQLSYYDAFRGELYRDFADPIGMASRALVEGLFGVEPDMLNGKLTVNPGWPEDWDHAKLETPDIKIDYSRNGKTDSYTIVSHFRKKVKLLLKLRASSDQVKSVTLNGEPLDYKVDEDAIGSPEIRIETPEATEFNINVEWSGKPINKPEILPVYALGDHLRLNSEEWTVKDYNDPQKILREINRSKDGVALKLGGEKGWRTMFVRLSQGDMTWWQPLTFELRAPVDIVYDKSQPEDKIEFVIRNNSENEFEGFYSIGSFRQELTLQPRQETPLQSVPVEYLVPGTNTILVTSGESVTVEEVINWNVKKAIGAEFETVSLGTAFNNRVSNIFEEQYYHPRSPYPTLSIPVQGIGDWCSYRETEEIDDAGIREKAGAQGKITSPQGVPFAISPEEGENILFTSQWDNYPDSAQVDLSGKASHIYLLMAGSMHHMQVNMMNGRVRVEYADGSNAVLPLNSPENWWPIEQDYYEDGYAFEVHAPRPPRLYLKSGEWHMDSYDVLRKNGTNKIEGGAATLLDLPLNPDKELKSLTLMTNTTDVVIGLMAATLQRVK
ncbi:DUF4450 domain-containing protein [Saccharicrinis sp. FJH62]|uniref:DUF4450 domain-containing protein n=1 Tax=Saccharicrinis sp. FJH62 TaxID=3344657 RepID=UPI0035D4398E